MKIYIFLMLMSLFIGVSYSAAGGEAKARGLVPRDSVAA